MTDVAKPDREADLFAAGCIIAQLFSKDGGLSFLELALPNSEEYDESSADVSSAEYERELRALELSVPRVRKLPLSVKVAVAALVSPNRSKRPDASLLFEWRASPVRQSAHTTFAESPQLSCYP